MDLHRTSMLNHMDYNNDTKDGKGAPGTEERLDSGLDSLKEEEYQAVAEELRRLRVDNAPQAAALSCTGEQKWKTQITEDGDTLLHLAIIHEAKECIREMIEQSRRDPFLNIQNYQRQTPLHLAVITDQADVVELLLVGGCDPALVDDGGDTALHIACRQGSMLCFSVLTQNCPTQQLTPVMATCNYSGHNCLHLASIKGFLSLVESLVKLGADIDAQEQCNGRSALHLAVDLQNLALVRLLLRAGANPNGLTYGGHSAYHLTYGREDDNIRNELHPVTSPALRELPDSESEDSEEEDQSDDEEVGYDDITWNGHQ